MCLYAKSDSSWSQLYYVTKAIILEKPFCPDWRLTCHTNLLAISTQCIEWGKKKKKIYINKKKVCKKKKHLKKAHTKGKKKS